VEKAEGREVNIGKEFGIIIEKKKTGSLKEKKDNEKGGLKCSGNCRKDKKVLR